MTFSFRPMILTLTLLSSFALAAGQPAVGATLPAAPGNDLIDLGGLGGQTTPTAINVRGQVAGTSTTAGGEMHAFVLQTGGQMLDLGTMGGAASFATGLNNQ